MIEWRDEAILLSARRHGESALILSVLTRVRGRHAGLVRGGQSRRMKGALQPGNRIAVTWRARLEEHLGTMTAEPVHGHAALLMGDAGRLLAMAAALALVEAALPEREAHPDLFDSLDALMLALDAEDWAETYVRWEVGLLAELGFGLDLSACAATGSVADLVFVSPKSGRAVSAEAGAPYRDRLLALPRFLSAGGPAESRAEVEKALRTTEYFLARHVFDGADRPLPDARQRLVERLRREAGAR
jgi:DNA repair protein RecO (recombination protein O)